MILGSAMLVLLGFVGFFWLLVIFFDMIFKTCMFHPYFKALYTAGLDIKPFVIFWRITRFNRYINRMGLYRPAFVKTWFRVGAIIVCAIFFPCLFLYTFKLVSLLQTDTSEEFESSKLVPVIPGFNFPLSQWKIYVCVILFCSLIHEVGHAIAASRLGISVESFGFALCLIAPVAFVDVKLERFRYSSRWEQLSILCAGIWHNIILSLSCLVILKYFVLLISPLFYVGGGVTVLHINEQSELNNPVSGFATGDLIYAVGNCTVKDLDSWNACLRKMAETSEGMCVPRHLLFNNSNSVTMEKCLEKSDHLYFGIATKLHKAGTCLRARTAIQTYRFCTKSSECEESSLCAFPHLPQSHKFVVIERYQKNCILFAGLINELYMDVKVSEFLPRWKFISPNIAETIKEFLEYVLIFSNGFACLNVLPIFSLDGTHIAENLIHIILYNYFSFEHRRWFANCISTFALIVAGLLLAITLYKMFIFYM